MEHSLQTTNLADILERVLDKGIVIAGDITISLVEIDLLNIKLRLLIASVDKAKELGINWWETDPKLSSKADGLQRENQLLRERLEQIETKLRVKPRRRKAKPQPRTSHQVAAPAAAVRQGGAAERDLALAGPNWLGRASNNERNENGSRPRQCLLFGLRRRSPRTSAVVSLDWIRRTWPSSASRSVTS